MDRRRIYLDYMASTPCDPSVVGKMLPFLTGIQGNPSSPHWAGKAAAAAIEEARSVVAEAIGCLPEELVFTSGATESINLALIGVMRADFERPRRRIVTYSTEHKAVLGPCGAFVGADHEVVICPVHADGRADLAISATEINGNTALVSIQLANNEIGTIQPVREVAQLAHASGALVHVDGAQALGKLPIDVDELGADLMSFSAHKCYGPMGAGALYVRGGSARSVLQPCLFGGGQENALRPGTPNLAGIVGFGEAVRLSMARLGDESAAVQALRNQLEREIVSRAHDVEPYINGALGERVPGCSSITFPGVDADAVLANVPELALSSSSACASRAPEPSHVLRAIGLSRADAYSTIRVGVGRFTTQSDITYAVESLAEAVCKVREASGFEARPSGAQPCQFDRAIG